MTARRKPDPLSEAREALRGLLNAQGAVLLGVARADGVRILARLDALPAPWRTWSAGPPERGGGAYGWFQPDANQKG